MKKTPTNVGAIGATFARRGTLVPAELPLALTDDFGKDRTKNTQWKAFVRKTGATDVGDLADTVAEVATFVGPPLTEARHGRSFSRQWPRGGPWS